VPGAKAAGLTRRSRLKPAGDAGGGRWLYRIRLHLVIVATSVGLPLFSPAAFAPDMYRAVGHNADVGVLFPQPTLAGFLCQPGGSPPGRGPPRGILHATHPRHGPTAHTRLVRHAPSPPSSYHRRGASPGARRSLGAAMAMTAWCRASPAPASPVTRA